MSIISWPISASMSSWLFILFFWFYQQNKNNNQITKQQKVVFWLLTNSQWLCTKMCVQPNGFDAIYSISKYDIQQNQLKSSAAVSQYAWLLRWAHSLHDFEPLRVNGSNYRVWLYVAITPATWSRHVWKRFLFLFQKCCRINLKKKSFTHSGVIEIEIKKWDHNDDDVICLFSRKI